MIEAIQLVCGCLTATWLRVACLTLSSILVVDVVVRRLLRIRDFRRKIDKLPGPPTSNPILGNIPANVLSLLLGSTPKDAGEFYTSQIQSVLGHTLIYKDEPIFRLWIGQEPVICVWKPEMVELVLSDNFLLEKSYHYDFLRPWLGNGLLTSPGKIWRPRRKLLVPSFHFNILQAFVPVFDRKSKLLVRNIKRKLAEAIKGSSSSKNKDENNDNGGKDNNATIIREKSMHTRDGDEYVDSACKRNRTNSIVVDITPVITACTLDAICETIMGVSIDAQENPNNDYCQSVYIVGETFLERIIQPRYWLDFLFRCTELGKLYNYHLNKLHSFTRKVIAEKKSEKIGSSSAAAVVATPTEDGGAGGSESTLPLPVKGVADIGGGRESSSPSSVEGHSLLAAKLKVLERTTVDSFQATKKDAPKLPKAFLDLLLDKLNSSGGQKLTDEEIREEVDTFMFEGHDTTAMALSWTLFLLGHNKSAQQKLQEEVDQVCAAQQLDNESDLELEHIKPLKYLDCVIKEALRLCPSVPFIGRQTRQELKMGDYVVPPGSVLFVLIYQLHRNSEIFPNPEQFIPERFLPENTLGRHPFAYVPFSAGPRNCIGQKFAMAEMKTILLHLVRNFSFESITPLDKARVQMEMVLRPKCPLNIRISPRFSI